MGKENNLHDFLVDVADAIREKKGTTDLINPQDFADEIRSIESGGGAELIDALVDRTITEYENDTITEIAAYVFSYCRLLTRVSLPSVITIDNLAFAYCSSLADVNLPSLKTLGQQSLRNTLLTVIDFPMLEKMDMYAFSTCTNLSTIILRNNIVCNLTNTNAIGGTPIAKGTGYIYVPSDLVDAYKSATNWSTYADKIKSIDELPNE